MPSDKSKTTDSVPKAEPELESNIEEPEPKPEPIAKEEAVPEPVLAKEEVIPDPVEKEEPKPEITELEKPIEKSQPTVFEATPQPLTPEPKSQEKELNFDLNKTLEPKTEAMSPKVEVKQGIDTDDADKKSDKNPEEGILVEADADAIEAALKKHSKDDKADSFKEADEKTIVDRVLSQKKKGKWSKK